MKINEINDVQIAKKKRVFVTDQMSFFAVKDLFLICNAVYVKLNSYRLHIF